MNILITNGRVIDPASGLDRPGDLAIADGKILSIGDTPSDFRSERTLDASGCIVAPGLVDLAARLREPGYEHEGMLDSEMTAAVARSPMASWPDAGSTSRPPLIRIFMRCFRQ